MWLIRTTLLVALAAAGWALTPDIVNIPADGKLSEGKYVIYDKHGAEEASVLVTKDMLRTGEENNLRTLHTWLNKYFDKEDKNRPQIHEHHGPYGPNYVYGGGSGSGSHHTHPAVTVINGVGNTPGQAPIIGSTSGGTVIPPGAIVIRPATTTHRPPSYPDHHHHGDGDWDNYPNRPHYPDRYPHGYPDRYPDRYPERYPYPDRYPPHHHYPDRDGDRYHGYHPDRDGDRDRYPYDRYPHGHYPYDEYNGYDGQRPWPYGPWAKLRSATAVAPRAFFPIYAHQLDKAAGKV